MQAAKDDLNGAIADKEAADNEVVEAEKAVSDARNSAEKEVDDAISNAQSESAAKEAAVKDAQDVLDKADEAYSQGVLGLIDWTLAKDDLSESEIADLNRARTLLIDATEEDFSRFGKTPNFPEERNNKVIVIGDQNDATSLKNIQKSLQIMKRINELRASDDNYVGDMQRNDAYTNFYLMVTAEAGAMRGAGLLNHSVLNTSCENLAFGYSDPNAGWYTKEKKIFDRIKGELGITQITSSNDIAMIRREAANQGVVIGHYTNLLYAVDEIMGVGYTQYNGTSCYNASTARASINDDRLWNKLHAYTVNEFENLVNEYMGTINKENLEAALENAQKESDEAKQNLENITNNKEALIDEKVKDQESRLAESKTKANEAATKVANAQESLSQAEKNLAAKENAAKEAENDLIAAQEKQKDAEKKAIEASDALKKAEADRDSASANVNNLKNEADKAAAAVKAAEDDLESKKEVLDQAQSELEQAKGKYDNAVNALAELTSDDSINKLTRANEEAKKNLDNAAQNKAAKEAAVNAAEEKVAGAQKDAEEAAKAAETAKKKADAANDNKTVADRVVRDILSELDQMKEQYAEVVNSAAAADAAAAKAVEAADNLAAAEKALKDAENKLNESKDKKKKSEDLLRKAAAHSIVDAMEHEIGDTEFAYLNDYVKDIIEAQNQIEAAKGALKEIKDVLKEKEAVNDIAQKEYIDALALLAIAKDAAKVNEPINVPSDIIGQAVKNSAGGTRVPFVDTSVPAKEAAVPTGDRSGLFGTLNALIASAGIMAAAFGLKRKNRVK